MTEDEATIKPATIIKPTRLPAATDNDLASMTTNHPTGNFYDDGEELQILFMEKAGPFPCFGYFVSLQRFLLVLKTRGDGPPDRLPPEPAERRP